MNSAASHSQYSLLAYVVTFPSPFAVGDLDCTSRQTNTWCHCVLLADCLHHNTSSTMVDPFTIIGTTAAVLDFTIFAGKVIRTAYILYQSEAGSTVENAKCEEVTLKMTQLLDVLKSPPDEDENLVSLAGHCHGLCEKILALLGRSKLTRGHSFRDSLKALKAAGFNVWDKSTISDLRKDLHFCTSQVNIHLTVLMR